MKFSLKLHSKKTPEFSLQAPEYKNLAVLRLINIFALGFFALAIFGISAFMYNNIYMAIGQMQSLVITRTQLGAEAIDFPTLDKVREKWENKHNTATSTTIRDAFTPVPTTTLQ